MKKPHELTIKTFHEGLLSKEFSALEIVQSLYKHVGDTDGKIGAYLNLNQEVAGRDAEAVDIALAEGKEISPLAGVPLAIKDNILIKGLPATAASKILENYTASYDAGVIKKLKAERAVFLGKTNMDEFAMGSSTENSAYQITKNPHDTTRVPGGSSGGSAAAVAAHMAIAALGSDTFGSIRQPASFCGIVGLKPTYGAISRSGLIAMASSMDQIGPMTKTVEDAAILFGAISGPDQLDATSTEKKYEKDLLEPDFQKMKNLKIGIPKEYFIKGVDETVTKEVMSAIKKLKSLGINLKEISLPHTKYAISSYYIVMPAEVSSNLARFDGIRYARIPDLKSNISNLKDMYLKQRGLGFGQETKRRIILGTFVLSSGHYDAYYEKAQKVRGLVKNDFEDAFKEVDVILTPVAPTPAFKIGEKINNPVAMYLSDIFTGPANLAGVPAVSIPTKPLSALAPKELPIGFQLIGRWWHEADILGLGQYYEKLNT